MRGYLPLLFAFAAAAVSPLGCVDIVHTDQVQALGDEAPGVRPGPTHRPGQPCLVCHGGQGPASFQMSLGGTVYDTQGQSAPAEGVQVRIEDITGASFTATTNSAGNFFVPLDQWQPKFPLLMQISQGSVTQQMLTYSSREGSCAGCHSNPPGSRSPGPIYVKASQGP